MMLRQEKNQTQEQQTTNGKQANGEDAKKEEGKTEKDKDAIIKELEEKVKELNDKSLLLLADRENVRKIGQREVDNAKQFGHQSFAADMLSVADNLGHCLHGVPKEELETNKQLRLLYEGLVMTESELQKTFKKHKVEKFEPLGQPFNPNTMNAIFHMAPDPTKPGNTVGAVLKAGYMLGTRCLRPADVGVLREADNSEKN